MLPALRKSVATPSNTVPVPSKTPRVVPQLASSKVVQSKMMILFFGTTVI